MTDLSNFLNFSQEIIKRKIVGFSLSTCDIERYSYCFRSFEEFFFDSKITTLHYKENLKNYHNQPFDDNQLFDITEQDKKNLKNLFLNYIKKTDEFPQDNNSSKRLRPRAYSEDLYDAEKLVTFYHFKSFMKNSLKKVLKSIDFFIFNIRFFGKSLYF